jgi:hypothetical protein
MSTRQPPWAAQGQLAVTLLPPTRASNSVTARRPPGPGSTAALRGLAGPCARDLPVDLGWPGGCRADHASTQMGPSLRAMPSQPSPNRIDQHHTRGGPGRRQPTRRDHGDPNRRGTARPRRVCSAWVGEQSKHGCAETQWQTPRRRRRTDGARLRRNPNLRRGRLHYSALPVQPRSTLRDPPRLGPAGDDPHEATPLLSCRGRWSAQDGGRFNVVTHALAAGYPHHSAGRHS